MLLRVPSPKREIIADSEIVWLVEDISKKKWEVRRGKHHGI
jgi:hypothetical protein